MRRIRLSSQEIRDRAVKIVSNLPVDGSIQVVIEAWKKKRSLGQNAMWWGVRLSEIASQAWVDGRQFTAEVWHEHLKREFLPDGTEEGFPMLVNDPERYRKWDVLPSGELICVGSTTALTTRGFAWYMERVEAYAARELGVMFSAERR